MDKINRWVPAIVVCSIIFALSSIHGSVVQDAGLGKESYHINAHFVLYFFLFYAFYKATKNIKFSMFISFLYGVTDELHQLFVPGRAFQLIDLAVDFLGILLAAIILWKLNSKIPKKLRSWLEE
jgi:VanZ family protein